MFKKLVSFSVLCALVVGFTSSSALCADYPRRNITLIVPYAAGGGTDTQARIAGVALEKILGKSFTIVNKTGGNGVIGFTEAASARPDGYSLGFLAYPDLVIPPEYKKTHYSANDFQYIGTYNSGPVCLIISPDAPYKTTEELIAYGKENPGKITIGVASDSHMLGTVMFENATGMRFTPIVYKSGSEALNGLLGGHLDACFIASQFADLALQQGYPVLGATDVKRSEFLPDTPTFKEQGIDIVMLMNRIFVAPKNTPKEIVDILTDAFIQAQHDPELIKSIQASGDEIFVKTGTDMVQYIEEQNKIYMNVIQENKERFAMQ